MLTFVDLFKTKNSGQTYVLDQGNYGKVIRLSGLIELHGNVTRDHEITESGVKAYKNEGGFAKAVKDAIYFALQALKAEVAIAKGNGKKAED